MQQEVKKMVMIQGKEVDLKEYDRVINVCENLAKEFGIRESYLRRLISGRKERYPKLDEITIRVSPRILMIKTQEFRKFILEMFNKES